MFVEFKRIENNFATDMVRLEKVYEAKLEAVGEKFSRVEVELKRLEDKIEALRRQTVQA